MNIIHKRENEHGCGRIIALIPANKRTIRYEFKDFFLSFPTMAFCVDYSSEYDDLKRTHNVFVGFAPELNDDQTKFYMLPLPNATEYGLVCFGRDLHAPNGEQLVKNVIDYFWSSRFEHSGMHEARKAYDCLSGPLNSLHNWAEYTKANPSWTPQSNQLLELSSQFWKTLADWKK